jgi:hypothetical protein
VGDVQNRSILDAAPMSDTDFVHIATNNGHRPDGNIIAGFHIANHYGTWIDPCPFPKMWRDTLV